MNMVQHTELKTNWYVEGGTVAATVCTKLVAAGVGFHCAPAGNGGTVIGRERWFEFTLTKDSACSLRPACAYDEPHYPKIKQHSK